jgi:hypothetical protein
MNLSTVNGQQRGISLGGPGTKLSRGLCEQHAPAHDMVTKKMLLGRHVHIFHLRLCTFSISMVTSVSHISTLFYTFSGANHSTVCKPKSLAKRLVSHRFACTEFRQRLPSFPMAYWLYKKIRDRKRNSGEQHLLGPYPETSKQNEASIGAEPSDKETSRLDPQLQEHPRDKQAQKEARVYRWRLIGGLFLPATVQALNTTLIAGALPFIASDFNEFAQINWIVTAYNLTAAAFIPIVSATYLLLV